MVRHVSTEAGAKGAGGPSTLPPGASVAARDGVCFRMVEDEAVLLDLASGMYYSLNQVATRAWVLMHETHEVESAIATLLTEYAVPEDRLRRDIGGLVTRLAELGLLTFLPP
jgi:hypothetical protein